jgi:hypothetical protein
MTTKNRPFVGKTPMAMALAQDLLHNLLKTEVIRLYFEKLDGTMRRMKCTLKSDLLPEKSPIKKEVRREKSPGLSIFVVWDVEKEDWRSVRYESVVDAVVL